MHYISKNWERIFHFQYKVAIGQCDFWNFFIYKGKCYQTMKSELFFENWLFSELLQNIAFRISGSTDLLINRSK